MKYQLVIGKYNDRENSNKVFQFKDWDTALKCFEVAKETLDLMFKARHSISHMDNRIAIYEDISISLKPID